MREQVEHRITQSTHSGWLALHGVSDCREPQLDHAGAGAQAVHVRSPQLRQMTREHVEHRITQSSQSWWLALHDVSEPEAPQFEQAPATVGEDGTAERSTKNSSRSTGRRSRFSSTHWAARPLSGLFVL